MCCKAVRWITEHHQFKFQSESSIKVNNSFQEAENEFSIIPGISTILQKMQSNDSWIHHQEVTLKSTTARCRFSIHQLTEAIPRKGQYSNNNKVKDILRKVY
jgi:hypothetical protein